MNSCGRYRYDDWNQQSSRGRPADHVTSSDPVSAGCVTEGYATMIKILGLCQQNQPGGIKIEEKERWDDAQMIPLRYLKIVCILPSVPIVECLDARVVFVWKKRGQIQVPPCDYSMCLLHFGTKWPSSCTKCWSLQHIDARNLHLIANGSNRNNKRSDYCICFHVIVFIVTVWSRQIVMREKNYNCKTLTACGVSKRYTVS